jgi:hypothetical protein
MWRRIFEDVSETVLGALERRRIRRNSSEI